MGITQSSGRANRLLEMWDIAAELCAARLAAEPNTKELRDLVYIAETLQDMHHEAEQASEAGSLLVVFDDPAVAAWAE